MLSTIDHVGVAVESIDAALTVYRDALGMPLVHREKVESQGVDAALLDVGDSHIELLQPLGPDTTVGKFLARRGPGLTAEDGTVALDLKRVVYVLVDHEDHRVGFGTR